MISAFHIQPLLFIDHFCICFLGTCLPCRVLSKFLLVPDLIGDLSHQRAQVPIDLSVTSPILMDGNWRSTRGLSHAIRRAEADASDALFGSSLSSSLSLSSASLSSSSLSSSALSSSAPSVVALGAWGEARLTHVREESLVETPTVRSSVRPVRISFDS
jgi:hypothetical protein